MAIPTKPASGANWDAWGAAVDAAVRSGVDLWQPSPALAKRTIAANYTLVLADGADIVLHCTASTGVTITVPSDAAVALPQETPIPWRQYGAGQITFAAGAGATLLSRGSVFKSAGQYAEGLLTKVAANTFLLSGDITA